MSAFHESTDFCHICQIAGHAIKNKRHVHMVLHYSFVNHSKDSKITDEMCSGETGESL